MSIAEKIVNIIRSIDDFVERAKQDGLLSAMFGMDDEAKAERAMERDLSNKATLSKIAQAQAAEDRPYNNPSIEAAAKTFQSTGKQVMMEHDLQAGVFAEAAAPNTPVVITSGGGDPEGIIRKSTVESMMAAGMGGNTNEIKTGLEDVVTAIGELNLETVITADQIRVIMAQGR